MNNRILRIGHFSGKLKFIKIVIFLCVCFLSLTWSTHLALATPYGEGNYGANLYGEDFPASSPASASSCSDTTPKSAPTITLITAKSRTEIQLTFTHAADPVTYYALEYGPESQKYIYSASNVGGHDTTSYTVQNLSPNKTYYFRLRAGNGCMPGEWSAEISGKTLGYATKALNIVSSVITPVFEATPSAEPKTPTLPETKTGYSVQVSVVNTKNEPIEGALVTIHSTPRNATTDKTGLAQFSDIEAGEHKLLIAYGDYSGEESIFLNGDVKEFKISVTVEEKKTTFSKPAIVIIATLVGVVAILLILIFIRRKRV